MRRSSSLVKWKIWIFYSWQTLTSFYCKLCKIIRNICIFAGKWISGHFVWWTIPLNLKLYSPRYWRTEYLFSLTNGNSYLSALNRSIKSQNAIRIIWNIHITIFSFQQFPLCVKEKTIDFLCVRSNNRIYRHREKIICNL